MTYSSHSFSVELATLLGMREAVILQHFFWWHEHNAVLPAMNIDGRVWFYLTADQIAEVFPYLSVKVVRNIVEGLIEKGYVIKEHKGQGRERFNRTNWYALTDAALVFFHFPKRANGIDQMGNIVNIDKDNSKSSNEDITTISITPTPLVFDFRKALLAAGVTPEVADAWLKVRKERKAINSRIAWEDIEREIAKSGRTANECIRLAVVNSWRGFKAAWLDKETNTPTPVIPATPRPLKKEKDPLDYDFSQFYK